LTYRSGGEAIMAGRKYQNFDLLIEAEPDGGYRARVTACPSGDSPSSTFTLPFSPTELENLLLKLDPGRAGVRRVADPQAQATMELGGGLYESVFAGDVKLAWSRSFDTAREAGDGLRLRLRMTDAPAIAGLPWELLYDKRANMFLAQSEKTPLVRYLEVSNPPRPFKVNGALRILVVVSSPGDLPPLDVEGEWNKVSEALTEQLTQGLVHLDRLPAATIDELQEWLRHHDVHILHFIGHGDFDEQKRDGVLWWTDRYGRGVQVTSTLLGPHVRDHDPLRLIVLNACQTARVDASDPFSGMAQGLIQQEATAVVAMQFPISDGAATAFTGEFYSALADGLPVDQAVSSARKRILSSFFAEWATPVLFSRAPDGQVFDAVAPEAPVATPAPEPQPKPEPIPAPEPQPETVPPPERGPAPEPAAAWSAPVTVQSGSAARTLTTSRPEPPRPEPPRRETPSRETPRRKTGRNVTPIAAAALLAIVVGIGAGVWAFLGPGREKPGPPTTHAQTDVHASRFSTPPDIDAQFGEWAQVPLTHSDHRVRATNTDVVDGEWRLGWDDDNLYLAVIVTDSVITQTHESAPTKIWNGDSVSMEFGPYVDPHGDRLPLQPGDVHLMIGPTADVSGTIDAINRPGGSVFGDGSEVDLNTAVAKTEGGYAIEAAVPWSDLNVSVPHSGSKFAANLNVSDAFASGARRGTLDIFVTNNEQRRGNSAEFRNIWGTITLD